ncbi:MAG: hypothetical protein A2V77_11345 [Anaeromyxobacter sp. RBG_16_69_14]|nr:MAG: hypothetical protein A2V77_11345 [Anaeromyxobacter sp. RBG_16_69_14]
MRPRKTTEFATESTPALSAGSRDTSVASSTVSASGFATRFRIRSAMAGKDAGSGRALAKRSRTSTARRASSRSSSNDSGGGSPGISIPSACANEANPACASFSPPAERAPVAPLVASASVDFFSGCAGGRRDGIADDARLGIAVRLEVFAVLEAACLLASRLPSAHIHLSTRLA